MANVSIQTLTLVKTPNETSSRPMLYITFCMKIELAPYSGARSLIPSTNFPSSPIPSLPNIRVLDGTPQPDQPRRRFRVQITKHRRRSFPVIDISIGNLRQDRGDLTSGKYVATTVRSANLRPARALRAFVVDSTASNLTKILPTPAICLLPPAGRGTLMSRTGPNFEHSSRTSSRISVHAVSIASH